MQIVILKAKNRTLEHVTVVILQFIDVYPSKNGLLFCFYFFTRDISRSCLNSVTTALLKNTHRHDFMVSGFPKTTISRAKIQIWIKFDLEQSQLQKKMCGIV